jgi:hypothetical protein
MACFDSGVSGFVKCYAVVNVNFPIDWKGKAEIACKHCNYFVRATMRCGLTQTIVNYPDTAVGVDCPLEIIETEKENEENV